MLDGTKLAQMVLSAIYRSGQIFGAIHIINILLGNKEVKVDKNLNIGFLPA